MSEKKQIRAIKGVRDILPPESALWNRVEQTARDVFATYNFQEIRLPIFEETELFARSVGVNTDIVSKEMYTFEDHALPGFERDRDELLTADIMDPDSLANFPGDLHLLIHRLRWVEADGELDEANGVLVKELAQLESHTDFDGLIRELPQSFDDLHNAISAAKSLASRVDLGKKVTLRPETTASVVRAYIEHGMHTHPGDVKLYYVGPMFRRERPQKGRYRQFYQIGAEVLSASRADEDLERESRIDAEVIEMLMVYLERLRLPGTTLYINSIGCRECRPAYVERLRSELMKVKDKLGADSQRRIETNPLRVLDSKVPSEQAIIEKLPRIADHLCADCRAHFARLQEQLKQRDICYEINWRLVRGLDYYMRTTFEITAPGLGAQNAICGGGRYDGLVELLGGPPTKGIGFAIGTDRLVLSLQEAGKGEADNHLDVFVAWMSTSAYGAAMKLARLLRAEGFRSELPAEEMKLKKSLGLADKLGARYALIIGEDEVASGSFTLKRMSDAEQRKLTESELVAFLKSESQRAPQTRPERASRISS